MNLSFTKNKNFKKSFNSRDIATLNPKTYINDDMMNGLAKLLITNNNILYITSNQYELFVKNNRLENDDRLKKKFGKKFLESDKIIILRNIKNHWMVYGISKSSNDSYTINIMDSYKKYTDRFDPRHAEVLKIVSILSYNKNADLMSYKIKRIDVPQQPNSYDCGIFSLMNIQYFSNNRRNYNYDSPCKYRSILQNIFKT